MFQSSRSLFLCTTLTMFSPVLRMFTRNTQSGVKVAHRALSTTSRLSHPLNSSHATSLPYSFLPANSLTPKAERTTGLTEIRGPYYAAVTATYLDELLSDWGEYVDGVKFAGGAFSLTRGVFQVCMCSRSSEVAFHRSRTLSDRLLYEISTVFFC